MTAELDLAVGQALGMHVRLVAGQCVRDLPFDMITGAGDFTRWSPTSEWSQGGLLIERFGIALVPPGTRVHDEAHGWRVSEHWTCTSWKLRKPDGSRAATWHPTMPLVAAGQLIVECADGRVIA